MREMGFSEEGYDNLRYNPKKCTYSESDVSFFPQGNFHPEAGVSHIVRKHRK